MSKCQHLAHAPITPGLAQHLMRVYLAKGAQATTAIEGNTLSESEVQAILERGTAGPGSSRKYQEQENKNILDAVIEIREALLKGRRIPITTKRLRDLNAKVLKDVPDAAHVTPGELRGQQRSRWTLPSTAPAGRGNFDEGLRELAASNAEPSE